MMENGSPDVWAAVPPRIYLPEEVATLAEIEEVISSMTATPVERQSGDEGVLEPIASPILSTRPIGEWSPRLFALLVLTFPAGMFCLFLNILKKGHFSR